NLRLPRRELGEDAPNAQRLFAQPGPHPVLAGGGGVALVEHQVDDFEHRGQSPGELAAPRDLEGHVRVAERAFGPHDALRDGGFRDQEGAGDLRGGQSRQEPQRERGDGSSAVTSASCASSSARPASRTRRASPAISRADSILQSASMVRWVSVAVMATDDTIVARAAQAKIPHALLRAAADTASRGFAQLTIQGVPKRSVHMPKRCAQKVSWTGMVTLPPSARVLKIRSASAGCSTAAITLKPSGVW